MSLPLSAEEKQRYTAIIDGILAKADLEVVTRSQVRQALETELGGRDLSEQKASIKKLIIARFNAVSGVDPDEPDADPEPDRSPAKRSAPTNGVSHSDDDDDEDASASPEPAKKKVKRSESAEERDAKLAAQLQAQENQLARGRTTRGGGDKKPKKKAPKKKSAKKVRAEDDSDLDSDASRTPKKKAGGGFQKPFLLSETLSHLVGESQLSRPQVVKKLWEHIKANDLQDPKDKRQIRCDEKMQAVFKQARVDMFKMNKDIGHHLYPVEEAEA